MVWRLLRDGNHGAAWNMAMDEAILDAVEAGIARPTLRLYGWNETAVSVGRFQDVKRDINQEYCQTNGIPIVRRPTGGRAILHGSDVTATVVVPNIFFGHQISSISVIYATLSAGFIAAFMELGMPLSRGQCERPTKRIADCFQVRSAADMMSANGTKMVGSAMRRVSGAVLQQSSVRRGKPDVRSSTVFRGMDSNDDYYPLEHLDEAAVHDAVILGFRKALGIEFCSGDFTGWEEQRAAVLIRACEVNAGNRK